MLIVDLRLDRVVIETTGLADPAPVVQTFHFDDLLRQHAPADAFYLVLDGQVEIKLALPGQGIVTLETVGPDEAVGWSWFQPPYRCQFDARAVTPVRVLAFDAARLRDLMERDPAVGYAVLKTLVATLSERVQSCRLQVLDVYAPPGAAP